MPVTSPPASKREIDGQADRQTDRRTDRQIDNIIDKNSRLVI